jgi:hypothetical protein
MDRFNLTLMKKLLLFLFAFIAFTAQARATNIDIGASTIVGFNSAVGSDTNLSSLSVTLGSPNVTCSSCLSSSWVGMGGYKVSLAGVVYEVASVPSRSAFTLTTNYAAGTGTVSGIWYKFAVLRIYVKAPFIPFGESFVVQSGTSGSTAMFRRYAVSVINDGAQNIAQLPQINDLPATTDSNNATTAYISSLYTMSGGLIQSYPRCVSEWRLDHLTSPTSWAQICQFNSPPNPPPPQPLNFLTAAQINARFPSCFINNVAYFAATGNVQSCLSLSSDFAITGGILSLQGPITRIQEEGSNLPQRPTVNFIGAGVTGTDDPGNNRTNVTVATPLNNLALNVTNGFWTIGGAGATGAARTILGTTNRITVTGGDGSVNPVIDIGSTVATSANNLSFFSPTTSAQLAGVLSDETGSGPAVFATSPSLTTPTVSGGTFTSPRIVTSINDNNGNVFFDLTATGSGVNRFGVTNATAGNAPTLASTGTDTNINIILAPKGAGGVSSSGNVTIAKDSPFTIFQDTVGGSGSDFVLNFNGGITNIGRNGQTDLLLSNSTGVYTFGQIPVLPASNPTTANQAVRQQYVLDTTTAWSACFFDLDPSTSSTSTEDRASFIVPDGTSMTITKLRIKYSQGSHTSGATITYSVIVRNTVGGGAGIGNIVLDNTNNTINNVYTNDIGDQALAPGDSVTISMTRSGTITERSVSPCVIGTQKRIP